MVFFFFFLFFSFFSNRKFQLVGAFVRNRLSAIIWNGVFNYDTWNVVVRNGIVTLSLFPEPMDQDYACPNFKTPDFILFFLDFYFFLFFFF